MTGEVGFAELCLERARLRDAVVAHEDSIKWFLHPDKPWFVMEEGKRAKEFSEPGPKPVRHLTTTATCLESLLDPLGPRDSAALPVVEQFAELALTHASDEGIWESEEAARIYCRVRALTPIIALAEKDLLFRHRSTVRELAGYVWNQVDVGDRDRQGVAERPEKDDVRQGYPPNAYHTYWAIRMLKEWETREGNPLGPVPKAMQEKRRVAELWSRQTLARQTALINNGADRIDAHQLAWALSTDFIETDHTPVTASTPHLELYRAALAAYFRAQQPSGAWPLFEPLFHYPAAGNAYCYTFETLAQLLRPALHKHGGQVLRTLLRPYLPQLLEAWHFAEKTMIELTPGGNVYGWCSGHHPHRVTAEAWATASVFSYLQALRCLVGHWTFEEARERRRGRKPRWVGKDGADKLAERGELWPNTDGWAPGRQLAAMFMHPIAARVTSDEWIDRDRKLITEPNADGDDQARSAILFGPPGTGKTTLVESLAGAIEWDFVEVLASDFLSKGMDRVPAEADEIFDQLMELDHCVILFDEIDELMRRRDNEADPFGRFLTTSMLPKLAKLWEQRKVLFFVATNDVDAADPAIKRTQRFDARIFVTPPAFEVKKRLLTDLLKRRKRKFPRALTREAVEKSLFGGDDSDAFGYLALLRYDQMGELARLMVQETAEDEHVPAAAAREALSRMGTQLASVEWEHEDKKPYELWRHHAQNESYDDRMIRLARVPRRALPENLESVGMDGYARLIALDGLDRADGEWELEFGTSVLGDHRRLDFSED